jgi:uncharacterized membrane protein
MGWRFPGVKPEPHFRWRGAEISRIEGFSDAVFAFAVTLLVVSLEVPHTFHELAATMKGFVAFGICFALILGVWREHAIFFRRYGLQTGAAHFLNACLLFVVLFYVYPLKFLFTLVVGEFTGATTVAPSGEPMITTAEVPKLMIVYGLGYAAVFIIFGFMFLHAYRQRHALGLNRLEVFVTRRSLIDDFAMAAFGIVSAIVAAVLPPRMAGLAGWIYMAIGIYHTIMGSLMGKRERVLAEELTELHRAQAAH